MTGSPQHETRRIVFVARGMTGESLRSARALRELERVCLLGICEERPTEHGAEPFVDLLSVADTHNWTQLLETARTFERRHGPLDQIVTAHETLLEPVARTVEALGLRGMTVATVRRALDKSSLKRILKDAGIKTARDQVLMSDDSSRSFVAEVGFPIVLKPINGSGGLATWCIRNEEHLELALELMRPSKENAVLAEVYLQGQELCIDTITVAGEPRFYSLCCYRPPILEALENPRVQWSCVMPRDITGERYREFIEQGLAAVRALSVGNAMTHMEGFLLDEGGLSFTDATLRPAGARIGPMLAFAYDMDPYRAWARVTVDGRFDGPWERRYAVGTIFLRGAGCGRVVQISGLDNVKQQLGPLLVDARLPRAGAPKSETYTGDGYITVRHPETRVVEDALESVARTVRIAYSNPEDPSLSRAAGGAEWSRQIKYFAKQLNRPAWDNDSMPSLEDA